MNLSFKSSSNKELLSQQQIVSFVDYFNFSKILDHVEITFNDLATNQRRQSSFYREKRQNKYIQKSKNENMKSKVKIQDIKTVSKPKLEYVAKKQNPNKSTSKKTSMIDVSHVNKSVKQLNYEDIPQAKQIIQGQTLKAHQQSLKPKKVQFVPKTSNRSVKQQTLKGQIQDAILRQYDNRDLIEQFSNHTTYRSRVKTNLEQFIRNIKKQQKSHNKTEKSKSTKSKLSKMAQTIDADNNKYSKFIVVKQGLPKYILPNMGKLEQNSNKIQPYPQNMYISHGPAKYGHNHSFPLKEVRIIVKNQQEEPIEEYSQTLDFSIEINDKLFNDELKDKIQAFNQTTPNHVSIKQEQQKNIFHKQEQDQFKQIDNDQGFSKNQSDNHQKINQQKPLQNLTHEQLKMILKANGNKYKQAIIMTFIKESRKQKRIDIQYCI